jgi:hypothetical protein
MCSPSRRAGPTARAALARSAPHRGVGAAGRKRGTVPAPRAPGRSRPGVRDDIPDPAAVKTFPPFLETAA